MDVRRNESLNFEGVVMEKNTEKWELSLIINNEQCPYLFRPNAHGCDYYKPEWVPCKMENCPFVRGVK